MPLLKARLKGVIKSAFESQAAKEKESDDPSKSLDEICEAIASGVVDEIKNMTIIITGTAGVNPIVITSITIT